MRKTDIQSAEEVLQEFGVGKAAKEYLCIFRQLFFREKKKGLFFFRKMR